LTPNLESESVARHGIGLHHFENPEIIPEAEIKNGRELLSYANDQPHGFFISVGHDIIFLDRLARDNPAKVFR